MHVLIFTNHFWPENFRINDLALGLVEKGHEVSVVTGVPNYPEGKFFPGYGPFRNISEAYKGINIRRIPLLPRGSGSSFRLMLNYISSTISFCLHAPFVCRKKYDVIFVFETSPATIGLPAVLLKWMYRIPIVFWVLDLWPESLSATGSIKNRSILAIIRRVVRLIYSNCDKVLVSSKGFRSSIDKVGGYRGQIGYFPNWVEPEISGPGSSPPELKLPDGFRILFTGNIGAAQDFGNVLDAAEMLKSEQEIHWLIVGNGRMYDWVRGEVDRRGLELQFHLLGRHPIESMNYFFSVSDTLLLPLRRDPIFKLTAPGKLQSYMSSGLPILASLDGEGADIVSDAKCGIACEAGKPEQLRDAVLAIFRMSYEERKTMGIAGREFCEANFSREKLFSELNDTLISVTRSNETVR